MRTSQLAFQPGAWQLTPSLGCGSLVCKRVITPSTSELCPSWQLPPLLVLRLGQARSLLLSVSPLRCSCFIVVCLSPSPPPCGCFVVVVGCHFRPCVVTASSSVIVVAPVVMSESDGPSGSGGDKHPPAAAVPLKDLLRTIREAVQAEVNAAVARLASQQQPVPALPGPPSSVSEASSAASGELLHATGGSMLPN